MILLFIGIFIGSIVGYLLCRWDTKLQVKDLEAWNSTALKHICEVEDENQRLVAEKHETDLVWAEHNATHVCVLKPKEEEWPEDVSFQ